MLKFVKENTKKGVVPSVSGVYKFYDKNRRVIYAGHSNNLRHRIQSYHQEDDFKAHPTKKSLRSNIKFFEYEKKSLNAARAAEKRSKPGNRFNVW